MKISRVENIDQFDQLKSNWDQVYAADPDAHIFVSWMRLRGWFEITPYRWFVLAAQPDNESRYVAFLPLVLRAPKLYKYSPVQIVHMGGWPLAQYTGFVCLPAYQETVLSELATYIQQLNWDSFQLEYFLDPRLDYFLQHFPQHKFNIAQREPMPCLTIDLPSTWEQYLQKYMSRKTRKYLRNRMLRVDNRDGLYITQSQEDSIEKDIEILLALWQQRWGAISRLSFHRSILHFFFKHQSLWLNILWDKQTPVAALAGLLDQQKKVFYAYITGYDDKYAQISPGRVIFGNSIRNAIANDFRVYDFLRGEEPYKFSFGSTKRFVTYTIIQRKTFKSITANFLLNSARKIRGLTNKLYQ